MKKRLVFEVDPNVAFEDDQIKKVVHCDDAYGLLWDFDNAIRTYFQHGEQSHENAEELLEKIRTEIGESGLMEYYK